jgi:hypothetical protein
LAHLSDGWQSTPIDNAINEAHQMFITKFSGKILGIKGSVFRLHRADGEVVGIYPTMEQAEAAKAAA